ncbi:hypothetical protein AM609_13465 [Actinomyces sp. oral taxon 414]|uniref:hypothetical protein n=1 Tax=Actinomyces sp. oral taxon 414 TaxID=712122 RepID=UPI0006AE32E0|nr:hypothetical protein [Actinomyces sp. oral taxon 414]ALD00193.1 hypothetical protein AM609_13465 [Actinomyces sp. oral taxon 414]
MRLNTTTTRIFALAAAAACAAGLSACQSEVPVPGPTNGGDTTTVAPTTGAEQPTGSAPTGSAPTGAPTTGAAPTAGAVEARDIEPITFTDEAVGLTETCDQIITDFKAPSYQKDGDETTTIYLLHCTLDYSGGLSYDDEAAGDLKLIDDKDEFHYGRAWSLSSLDEDVKAAGMDPISYDDRGTTHVDGWFAFTVSGSDGKADPLPEGATTLVYERNAFTNKGTGKTYEAYSARSKVTIK